MAIKRSRTAENIILHPRPEHERGHMKTTLGGISALRGLRTELEEHAGENYPQDVLRELLVLHDVCECLDLNIFQKRDVLGDEGGQYLNDYLNSPVGYAVKS